MSENVKSSSSLGFIILRHVKSEQHNKLWIESYECIRKFYPTNKIVIIDDFSDYEFVDTNQKLTNTQIIQSEYSGRGEILPYYYYYKTKFFDRAVILHDSVFIQKYIDFGNENSFLWEFEHDWDYLYNNDYDILIKHLEKQQLVLDMYNLQNLWKGCFGVMSVINHDFLCKMNQVFNFINMIHCIKTRQNRMACERIFAVIFTLSNMFYDKKTTSIFGNIHLYCNGFANETYQTYIQKKNNNNIQIPIIKVWSGR